MNQITVAITLASIAAHLLLFVYLQFRGNQVRTGRGWLSLTIVLSALAASTQLLPGERLLADKLGREFALALALAATLTSYGALVIRDLFGRSPRLWLALGVVWLAGMTIAAIASETVTVAQPEWLVDTLTAPDAAGLVTLGGLALTSAVLLITSFYAFYSAKLPEVANRSLFWILNSFVVIASIVLAISGTEAVMVLGLVGLLAGMTGATYAQATHRVFDIRSGMLTGLRTLTLVVTTALVVYAALRVAMALNLGADRTGALLIAALAMVAAGVYVPVRQIVSAIFERLMSGSLTDPAQAARKYSQEVSKTVELEPLVEVATRTLNQVMRVRRSCLLLVSEMNNPDQRVELVVMMPGTPVADAKRGFLSKQSPVYQQLALAQTPLAQYDLEYSRLYYEGMAEEEQQFFHDLQMGAYAPIIVENQLIGVLACGAKRNDAPYYLHDMELLATMANQTGVALRNARLVAELRDLNRTMQALNRDLEEANTVFEKLDSVKTDFVTIASHELRTPLAQVRGYTDILDALNEQGELDRDQVAGMVANLRKATERMEELIAAMLDVSQLDVDAMDLRFAQASLESVVRMAIEPLNDAIRQRKLSLSARGLRGLPNIQADMQRLVQAFRNILVNSIKFTPDGGKIEITATLQPAEKPGEQDHILVAIADSGVGIDQEHLELIFQKFYRAYDPGLHSTGTYKFMGAGPGLGLTIAKGVIEGHGGNIWAESSGHNVETFPGSTFYVLLPVSPPEDARRVLQFEAQPAESVPGEPALAQS